MARPIVLCPLEFERRFLARARVDRIADLICCGPGAPGIQRWAAAHRELDRPVILAGLAGGLSERCAAGTSWLVTRVVDPQSSQVCLPSLLPQEYSVEESCTITSTSRVLINPMTKAELRAHTAADLVDLESVAFAQAAHENGWRWAIVRGVSDGPKQSLPPGIDQWVNGAGRVRPQKIALAIFSRPGTIRQMIRLSRCSKAAMMSVANRLKPLLLKEI